MIHLFRATIDSSGVFLAQAASLLLEGHWTGGCFPCFKGRQNFRRCCRIVFCLPLAHPNLSFGICDALAGRSSYGSHLLFGLMVLRRRTPVICYLYQQNISLVPCAMPQILLRNHSLYDPRIFFFSAT